MSRGYWGNDDRRRFQRLKMNLTVFYKIEGPDYACQITQNKEVEATMLDLSSGGMAFITCNNVPVRAKLLIKFYLFKSDNTGMVSFSDPVELIGEVRSNIMSNYNEYRLGICFKAIHNDSKDLVSDFVESVVRS